MNDRFSTNGDGKEPAPKNRISSTLGSQKPNQSENEREQQIIKALKGRYDQIEALWNEAEKDLKRFRVARTVRYLYHSDYDGGCPIHYHLTFGRYGKDWRICYERVFAYSEFDDKRDDEVECKPVIEWPLEVRLAMMSHFESLREKVIEEAEKIVPELDDAISNFRKMVKG
jgi:hypothetical protein